jgi:hypothetical protein
LNTKSIRPAEILRQLVEVFGEGSQVVWFVEWAQNRPARCRVIWMPVCHHRGTEREG